ncbi:MAG: gliding motility-associated C-terminal domain-containing protein [Chitinophagaceae bacterium]
MKVPVLFFVLLCIGINFCLPSAAQKILSKTNSAHHPAKVITSNRSEVGLNNKALKELNTAEEVCNALGIFNKDTSICLGASFPLHAKPANDYIWSPADGLSSTTDPDPIVTTDVTRTYVLKSRKFSTNLVSNGDFSEGDVNINSSYGYRDCTDGNCLIPEGLYGVGKIAKNLHSEFIGTKDHTTGSGNFMIVNGAGAPNAVVWSQKIAVKPNTDYNFSAWVSSMLPGSPAILQFQINGLIIPPPFSAPQAVNEWQQFFELWNSGNSDTARITILNQNTTANGNDFGLDDIFFQELTPCTAAITVTVLKKPLVAITASPTAICEGTPITFTATAKDEGPLATYQWTINGAPAGTNSPSFTSGALKDGDKITSTVTNSCGVTVSNEIVITVASKLTPSISIKATATDICEGTPVTFTSLLTNEGTLPQVQWKKNNVAVGTTGISYSDNALSAGDKITASLTSNAGCLLSPLAESNLIEINVVAKKTPTISITSSGTSICSGTPVTFTASATIPGAAPLYQWKKNGVDVGSNSSSYTDNALADGDAITALLTSSETCITTKLAESNKITIKVVSNLVPSITISASATTICPGTLVTFTAAANGGSAPEYKWKKNGQSVGTNAPVYTDNALQNGDLISCTLIANDPCVLSKVSESNVVEMKLIDKLTPTITISSSLNDICVGTPVTFSAIITNQGSTPLIQWKKNGAPVGNNTTNYLDNSIADGDVVEATLTSNAACLVGPLAGSNSIIMKVMAKRLPAISITASGTSICVGTPVTFTAIPLFGGSAPVYEWRKNGVIVGSNSPIYLDNNLVNGDEITATLTSNETCITTSMASSNPIKITVVSNLVPAITIKASSTSICPGTPVTFTATANGGSAPVYQWKKNGIDVGTNSVTYMDNNLNDGDVIKCILIANDPCVVTKETTSNSISIKLVDKVTPTISIAATVTTICPGTPVTFKAAITFGGSLPTYKWKKNGMDVGGNTDSYTDNKLMDGDEVWCLLLSNDFCVVNATSESNRIKISVNNSVLRPIDLGKDTLICSIGGLLLNAKAGYFNYKWQDGSVDSTFKVTKTGTYFVEALDGCNNKYNDTIKVVFDDPIPFTLGSDKIICIGDSTTISGSPGFASYTWYPQQNITGADKQTAVLFPTTPTTYTVFAKKSSGCTVIDSVHIKVNSAVPVNLGKDTSICVGDSLILDAGNKYATYAWSNGSVRSSITVSNKGAYSVKVKDGNGCAAMDTISLLNVFDLPQVRLNKDSILCSDSSKILDGGDGFKLYNWSTGQHTQNILVDAIGIYKLQVTDINGCKGEDYSKITRIIPTPKDFLPSDTSICSFDSIVLQSAISYKNYNWSTGQITRSINVKTPGNYLLQVMDLFGCTGTDSVMINPKECAMGFFIPTAFTPNGDGKNDLFYPIMNGVVKEYSFSVFNRWGEVVFTSEKAGVGWNGSQNGRPQTTNVFIWSCSYQFEGGSKEFKKGSVVLIK